MCCNIFFTIYFTHLIHNLVLKITKFYVDGYFQNKIMMKLNKFFPNIRQVKAKNLMKVYGKNLLLLRKKKLF